MKSIFASGRVPHARYLILTCIAVFSVTFLFNDSLLNPGASGGEPSKPYTSNRTTAANTPQAAVLEQEYEQRLNANAAMELEWRKSKLASDNLNRQNSDALARWRTQFEKSTTSTESTFLSNLLSPKWIIGLIGTAMAVISTFISVNLVSRNDETIQKIDEAVGKAQTQSRQISEALSGWLPAVRAAIQFLAVAPLTKIPSVEAEAAGIRILFDSVVSVRRAMRNEPVNENEPGKSEKNAAIEDLGLGSDQHVTDVMIAVQSQLIPKAQAIRDGIERNLLKRQQEKAALTRDSFRKRNIAAGVQILGTIIVLLKDLF